MTASRSANCILINATVQSKNQVKTVLWIDLWAAIPKILVLFLVQSSSRVNDSGKVISVSPYL